MPVTILPEAWDTDHSGDPLTYLPGWGLWEEDGYDDLVALRAFLKREPRAPEWSPEYLYPRVPAPSGGYYEPFDRSTLNPRQQKLASEREERQRVFLAALAQGSTIAGACEAVGVSDKTYRQWCHRFPEFANRAQRVRAGLAESSDVDENFVSRRRYYFGYETYPHHQQIIDAIEGTPPGGITLIIVAPEAGKTTLLEDYVCDQIALNPNIRITYVSESSELQSPAVKVLGTVKERMTEPDREDLDAQYETHIPEWIARFGPFRDKALDKAKPWNSKYIKVHRASGRRDYTFQAVSWRSKIYGSRCDKMIFDDVQSDEGLNLTDKMLSRFSKTFFNRPGRNGAIIFIGTRVGVGDVYERLVENIPDRMIRIIQIPALDENGNSYCPEMWPEDALADKRAIVGEDGWLTAYMMQPQKAGAHTFTEELLDRARDKERTWGFRIATPSLVIAGLDPALGGGNAITVAQTTPHRFDVLAYKVDYGLARNEDIFQAIRHMCRYEFTELVVERNSQQRGLARDDRLREMARIWGFRIIEHETGKNKWDFRFGVGAMAGSFIRGEIGFPDATDSDRKQMEAMRTELLAWRPDIDTKLLRQDIVMSLWFPWLIWMQRRKGMGKPTSWDMRGTPWVPGDMTGQWTKRRRAR